MVRWLRLANFLAVVLAFTGALAEDAADEDAADEEVDETKQLMDQLTISMVSEVIDERTVMVRDASATTGRRKTLIRLGNTASPEQLALSDEDHQAKLAKSKEALTKAVGKQMIWWKAGPDGVQPQTPEGKKPEETPVIADMWQMDGRHINGLMKKQGHLGSAEEYESELARDIMTVESEAKKKDAYEELAQAMKESQDFKKRKAAKETKKEPVVVEEPAEQMGLGAWIGLAVLGITLVGAALNFGRSSGKKKVNYNKKKGFFESLFSKLKGA